MTTTKQVESNRANAKLSTGPKSIEGKKRVSSNRISHGILSNKLLLANESAEDYQALLDDLQHQLRPVGTLELTLVERIAVSLWRQRRMVGAENSITTLNMTAKDIASGVSNALGLYGERALKPENLEGMSQEQLDQIKWCREAIAEHAAAPALNLSNLQKEAPLLFKQLSDDADADGETIDEHLANTTLEHYLRDLVSWCWTEAARLERLVKLQPAITLIADQVQQKLKIPWGRLDTLTKYQTALDNQTYKAMKALREAQEWRLKTIEVEPALDAEESVAAA